MTPGGTKYLRFVRPRVVNSRLLALGHRGLLRLENRETSSVFQPESPGMCGREIDKRCQLAARDGESIDAEVANGNFTVRQAEATC